MCFLAAGLFLLVERFFNAEPIGVANGLAFWQVGIESSNRYLVASFLWPPLPRTFRFKNSTPSAKAIAK